MNLIVNTFKKCIYFNIRKGNNSNTKTVSTEDSLIRTNLTTGFTNYSSPKNKEDANMFSTRFVKFK